MNDRRIGAVLFDMDETLIDHVRTAVEVCHDSFEAFKDRLEGVDETAFMKTFWQKANDLWEMMFDGVISGDVARPYMFINTLRALKADTSIAHDMLEDFELRLVAATRLAEGAAEVLRTLRAAGIRLGVVTNGYTRMQSRKIDHHNLREMTDFVLVSEAVGFHKPHRGIFEEALARAGVEAGATIFVGDNLKADIAGAVGAGMHAVLIDPKGERTRPET